MPENSSPYRHVLVGTDFSQTARCALDWAVRHARANDGQITLVHVIETFAGTTVPLELQDAVDKSLDDLARTVRQRGVAVSTHAEIGKAWQVLAEHATRHGADLLVIGTHGHSPLRSMGLGSTANRVVRTAPAPVLTIRPDMSHLGEDVRTVVAATDFSEESAQALSAAVRILRASGNAQKLVLVHACHTPIAYEPYMVGNVIAEQIEQNEQLASADLQRVAAPLTDEPFDVQCVAREGYPAMVVLEEARKHEADLLTIGTHGRSGASRLFLGSVAERVLHEADCPVLTIRKPATSEPMQLSA